MGVGSVGVWGRSVGTSRRDVRGLGGRVGLSSTPQLWEVPTMAESMSLVGLDVHASQTHAAVLDMVSGELRVEGCGWRRWMSSGSWRRWAAGAGGL